MRLRERLPERIESERLVLRAPRPDDLGDLLAKANSWPVLQWTGLPFPYEEEHGRAFLAKTQRNSHHPYAIAERDSDRLLGIVGLYEHEDCPTEIGYWLGEAHWGQGLATEAVKALLPETKRAGMNPLRALVIEGNAGSRHMLEKCGFTLAERTTSQLERHRGRTLFVMEHRA